MDKKQVIETLIKYKNIGKEIDLINKFISELEKNEFTASANNKNQNVIMEEFTELQSQKLKAQQFKLAVKAEIDKLDTVSKIIIYDFYIYKKQWQYISRKTNYCIRQCKNIRTSALARLGQRFETNNKIKRYKIK